MIQVRDVKKIYQSGENRIQALGGVSLDFQPGEFSALSGPSGSGKTTMLNILGCLDRPDSGTVSWDGKDLLAMDKQAASAFRRVNLGFVFQSFNLIPVLTAYENVALALNLLNLKPEEVRERTMAMLGELGLAGMEDRVPGKLSGGQQQRVAIARALVKNPKLVLADEPTANLDSATGEVILGLMKDMNRKYGTSFLFSTHDHMVMQYADRIVRLHDGQVAADERK